MAGFKNLQKTLQLTIIGIAVYIFGFVMLFFVFDNYGGFFAKTAPAVILAGVIIIGIGLSSADKKEKQDV